MGQELQKELVKAGVGLTDKTLTCFDCHKPYVFSARDQEFFAGKGWTPPKRCKPCREANKVLRAKEDGNR